MKTLEQITRAYQVLDHIERHPEKHDQEVWVLSGQREITAESAMRSCGTTACFAGWTVLLAGGTVTFSKWVDFPIEGLDSIPGAAAWLLGLDDDEEIALFYDAKDLPAVRKSVFDIFGPRPDGAL